MGPGALVSTGHLLALIAAAAVLLRTAARAAMRRWPIRLSRLAPAPFLAASGGGAALLAALTALVLWDPDDVLPLDAAASLLVAPYRAPWLLAAFLWLTTLGTGAALAGVALTATGFLWACRRGPLILPLWITFAGAEATVWIGKYVVGRARPAFLDGVAVAVSPSFPSAHATGATAVLGFVAYAVARELPGGRERFEVAFWTFVLVVLIGFSRVFLGVHFATDVGGGVLAGGSWLLGGVALAEWQRRPTKGTPDRSGLPS